jgi:hypothetical protein
MFQGFSPEDGDGMFILNVDTTYEPKRPHNRQQHIVIFTAVRILDLSSYSKFIRNVCFVFKYFTEVI